MYNQIIKCSDLIGTKVYNKKGKTIGKIEDVIIDIKSSNVLYGVLSFGGFFSMENKYFTVPVRALQLDNHSGDKLILDVSKEELENAPGFDKDNWPEKPSKEFIDSVYSHYDYE